ncbi:MAG: flagellar motor switch protein FliN [Pirellulales bacterium]
MADDSQQIGQNEIEELLRQAKSGAPGSSAAAPSASGADEASLGQNEIDALLGGGVPPAAAAKAPAEESHAIPQHEIEALLAQKARPTAAAAPAAPPPPPRPAVKAPAAASTSGVAPRDIELLLHQAEQALASIDAGDAPPPNVAPFRLEDFSGAPANAEAATLELIRDVELELQIELGRTQMYLEDVLKLRKGAVVPLDKLAGDPVDIYVNGRLIARGEVLVLNDNFCVRVAELVTSEVAAA